MGRQRMGEMTAEAARLDATILFERERCQCCDCCGGYCPDEEGDKWESPLIAVDLGGVAYIGTRIVIVRRDCLEGLPDDVSVIDVAASSAIGKFTVPDEPPPPFTGRHSAEHFDRLDRAGLVCRHVEGAELVHLYRDGEHVGWTRHAAEGKGITLDELGPVRRIAKATWLPLNRAATAYREALDVTSRPGQPTAAARKAAAEAIEEGG
jgi:hypothetical protein